MSSNTIHVKGLIRYSFFLLWQMEKVAAQAKLNLSGTVNKTQLLVHWSCSSPPVLLTRKNSRPNQRQLNSSKELLEAPESRSGGTSTLVRVVLYL